MRRNVPLTLIEIFFPIGLMAVAFGVRQAFPRTTIRYSKEGGNKQFMINKSTMSLPIDTMYEALFNWTLLVGYILGNETDIQKLNETEIENVNEQMRNLSGTNLGIGRWTYMDKAGGEHPFNIPTYKGFSLKPIISTICYDRFIIAYVGDAMGEIDNKTDPFSCQNDTLICHIARTIYSFDGVVQDLLGANFSQKYKFTQFESIKTMEDYLTADDYGSANKPLLCFGMSAFNKESGGYQVNLHYFDK